MLKKIDLLKRFEKIHGDKYIYEFVNYKGIFNTVKIKCRKHGFFEQTPSNHLNGSGCPECNSVKISVDEFIKRCNDKHNNFYDYSSIDFKGVSKKINIICPEHGKFEQRAGNHLYGQKCPYCSNKKFDSIKFIKMANIIHKNKYDYSLSSFNKSQNKIKIICKIHGVFEQRPDNHIHSKQGCPYCSKNKSNLELFKIKANEIHHNKYDYSLFIEYTNNKEKIKIICPNHGIFIQKLNNHLNGQGCPICLETIGERNIRIFLENNNIKFYQYKNFKECRYKNPLIFDFYLPDINTCIEYDGQQHFEPINHFGGLNKLKYTKKLDKIKDKFCIDNNIRIIRIKYNEDYYIKLKNII